MPSPTARSTGPLRLLVVADDANVLGDAAVLEATLGLSPATTLATGGREAAQALRASRVDLLLCDLGCLADLDPDAESALGRLSRLAEDALILTLSEHRSVSATMAAMRAGAHDHVVKPVAAAALAARIAALALRHGRIDLVPLRIPEAVAAAPRPALPRPPAARLEHDILPMWRQEQRIIEEAIVRSGGNVAVAAAALEISPSTIYRKRQAWADMAGETRGAA